MPAEDVLRLAGLLPTRSQDTAFLQEMIQLFGQLSVEDKERFVIFLRAFVASGKDSP